MMHGGDRYRNKVTLDFSINVNPLGTPESVKEALRRAVDLCERYPDPWAEQLKQAVGASLNVPEDALLFGNGASELFLAAVRGLRPKKTVLTAPSFFGYEYAAKAAGSEIVFYETKRENNFCVMEDILDVLTKDVGLLFLANPNNPNGGLLAKETIEKILRHCEETEIYVVLDESFIEFCGTRYSMLSETKEFLHLFLVRSYTKIFAIPGVRLGYLVCRNQDALAKIAAQIPEWNLSCFAQEAGCACAGLESFIRETEIFVKTERRFLEENLRKKGFTVFSSEANFILFYSEEPLYERLLDRGILIRDCADFRGLEKGFYRIAVKRRNENEMLLDAM